MVSDIFVMQSDWVVEGEKLERRFGFVHALRGLDLRVHRGESLTLFGPNGAGKTTLLRVLTTILPATSGKLRLFGEAPGPECRRRIGFVSHGTFLYPDLSAAENLRFYASLFGVPPDEDTLRERLDDVGLLPWHDRTVRTFSRGMEQRLALARAFLHDPELLFLDEPWSGLDPQAADHLQEILTRFHRQGRTVVVTTHDIPRGLEVSERAAVLTGGRIVWDSGRFLPGPKAMTEIYNANVGT